MKKGIALLLAFVLCFTLGTAALAAEEQEDAIILSVQSLKVDGILVECEKYNINGYNYFKLRDIAYLLNGTGSQFSVEWVAEKNTAEIVTGRAYLPVGGELALTGDHSETAVKSPQTIVLNGKKVDTLSVYNINNNNYFKLRDLAAALGFSAEYDEATWTMLVTSKDAPFWAPVKVSEVFRSADGTETAETTEFVLGPACNITAEHFTGSDYSYDVTLEYDARGNLKSRVYTCGTFWVKHSITNNESRKPTEEKYEQSDGTWRTVTYTYDDKGRLLKQVTAGSYDLTEEILYTYDAAGDPVGVTIKNNAGSSNAVTTFDENGNPLTFRYADEDGYAYTEEYSYDGSGNMLSCTRRSGDSVTSRTCTYDAQGRVLTDKTDTGGRVCSQTYAYDADGNVTLDEYAEGGSWQRTETEYDRYGAPVRKTDSFSDGTRIVYTTRYTRDAAGLVLAETGYQDDAIAYTRDYSYDDNGNALKISTQYYLTGRLSHSTEQSYEYAPVGDEHLLQEYERTLGYTEYAQKGYTD